MDGMNRKKWPLVSLITPGWNGKRFVHRLLDSILAQTYPNLEYVYVDDGSTDGTKEIVLGYQSKFEERGVMFSYVHKTNGGVSSVINEGLRLVKGDYLCWPEYDDFLMSDSIEKRVCFLEEHPDCAVVSSDAWMVTEEQVHDRTRLLSGKHPNRFDRNHFVQMLLSNTIFPAVCHMIRMSMFDRAHKKREIVLSRTGPNWQLLLPVYYWFNRGFIDEPLACYVVRPDSISHSYNTLAEIDMPEADRSVYLQLLAHYSFDRFRTIVQGVVNG